MSSTLASAQSAMGTTGVFKYLAATVNHSLYRNGEVLTRRDRDGSDAGTEGVVLEECKLPVANSRLLADADRRTLAKHGFELVAQPLADPALDFFEHLQVVQKYYPECASIVQDVTGAAHVFAFDHNVRSAAGKSSKKRIEGGQQVQGPAHLVHGDYTLTSAPQRLRDLTVAPGVNDTLRSVLAADESLILPAVADKALAAGGRFAIINVWRNIAAEPVATHPLALCDAQTVNTDELVVFEIHYHDRVGENYFARHAAQHRWYYYPEIVRDEAILIKQWDSAGELARTQGASADASASDDRTPCTFSFHSAFEDPATSPDAPDRWSIEVRCIVAYD